MKSPILGIFKAKRATSTGSPNVCLAGRVAPTRSVLLYYSISFGIGEYNPRFKNFGFLEI